MPHTMKSIFEVETLRGSQLSPEDQKLALRMFVHRFTKNHRPVWAFQPRQNGEPYPVQFASDADWLANSSFAVDGKGRLRAGFGECHSTPTWPDNPELRANRITQTSASVGVPTQFR